MQELLEISGIPYTGSGVLGCVRASDKVLAKHLMLEAGIPTPEFFAFSETAFRELGAAEALPAMEERLDFPIVVKPASGGSALGIRFARTAHDVPGALGEAVPEEDSKPGSDEHGDDVHDGADTGEHRTPLTSRDA